MQAIRRKVPRMQAIKRKAPRMQGLSVWQRQVGRWEFGRMCEGGMCEEELLFDEVHAARLRDTGCLEAVDIHAARQCRTIEM